MGRKIDYSKPLSDEDRAWLVSRNQHDTIAQIDAGWFSNPEADTTVQPKPETPTSVSPPPATGNELARLGDYIVEHFPSEVGESRFQNGGGVVDVTIRLLDRTLDGPAEEPSEASDEPESESQGETPASGEGTATAEGAPVTQEPIVDGTTAQDLGSDANPQQVAETPEQRPAVLTEERTADLYDEWTVDELKDELGSRELSKSGIKAELIARLREDDAA